MNRGERFYRIDQLLTARRVSGVLFPPAPSHNNPSHVHEGGISGDQGDSDQRQVTAAQPPGVGNRLCAVSCERSRDRAVLRARGAKRVKLPALEDSAGYPDAGRAPRIWANAWAHRLRRRRHARQPRDRV